MAASERVLLRHAVIAVQVDSSVDAVAAAASRLLQVEVSDLKVSIYRGPVNVWYGFHFRNLGQHGRSGGGRNYRDASPSSEAMFDPVLLNLTSYQDSKAVGQQAGDPMLDEVMSGMHASGGLPEDPAQPVRESDLPVEAAIRTDSVLKENVPVGHAALNAAAVLGENCSVAASSDVPVVGAVQSDPVLDDHVPVIRADLSVATVRGEENSSLAASSDVVAVPGKDVAAVLGEGISCLAASSDVVAVHGKDVLASLLAPLNSAVLPSPLPAASRNKHASAEKIQPTRSSARLASRPKYGLTMEEQATALLMKRSGIIPPHAIPDEKDHSKFRAQFVDNLENEAVTGFRDLFSLGEDGCSDSDPLVSLAVFGTA